MNANWYGSNETPHITKSNRGPEGFLITRVHYVRLNKIGIRSIDNRRKYSINWLIRTPMDGQNLFAYPG